MQELYQTEFHFRPMCGWLKFMQSLCVLALVNTDWTNL